MNDTTKVFNPITLSTNITLDDSILTNLENIIENWTCKDLRNLIKSNYDELLRETLQRGWKSFWHTSPNSLFNKTHTGLANFTDEVSAFSVCNETKNSASQQKKIYRHVLENIFVVESKKRHKEKIRKLVNGRSKRTSNNEEIPTIQERDVTELFPDLRVCLKFTYSNNTLTISISGYQINVPEFDVEKYLSNLVTELNNVSKLFERKYSNDLFILNFFDTLRAHKYCIPNGKDVLYVKNIYPNILKHFPEFDNLPKDEKINTLHFACKIARKSQKRDYYTFSSAIFYSIAKTDGINTLVKYDTNVQKVLTYKKVKVHYQIQVNPVSSDEIWENKRLVYVEYQTPKYKTSFMFSELSALLHKNLLYNEIVLI